MKNSLSMENQSENRNIQKQDVNSAGKPMEINELSIRSKNNKALAVNKSQQLDISGLVEYQRRLPQTYDRSPYATSYPLANRLYGLKNPQKYQPGLVGDRVMSAKLIKMKELESELTVLRKQLNEVKADNKLLRALQHREDHALKKFEGIKDHLPQLIQSHSEEVRALKAKCKKVTIQNRDLEKRLRNRETELRTIQEQNRHMQQLSKDRSLGERQSLREEVEALKNTLHHMELQFQEISKRKAIEQRNHQQRLQQEINLNRELKKSLLSAEQNINELKMVLLKKKIHFDLEENHRPLKSAKEVKKVLTPGQRLPLIGQQDQLEAVETFRESNLSTVRKPTNNMQKPFPSMVFKTIKSEVSPKDPKTVGEKKSTNHEHSDVNEGETDYSQRSLSLRNFNANTQESFLTSDDFYLSLNSKPLSRRNDEGDTKEHVTKSPMRGVKEISGKGDVSELTKDSRECQNATELVAGGNRADESTDEDSSSTNSRNAEEAMKREPLEKNGTGVASSRDAVTITVSADGESKPENNEVHQKEEMERIKKEKLLQELKKIENEEWADIDSDAETEHVQKYEKLARTAPHSFRLGKLNSDRSCSSSSSSAKSKKSPISRNSSKPDLKHDLFGTIPKSEFKLNKKKTSDPAIVMIRDIKS